jgi:hypothetical protein
MTPGDRPAALIALAAAVVIGWLLWRFVLMLRQIIHDRPIVTKDPHSGELQVVRSPNPGHRPRRHG